MRWRIEDVAAFCAVVDAGGVTGAALRLKMPKSTVSKALARLESELGLRLIERTSRRMRLTAEGATFLTRASVILELAGEADSEIRGLRAGTPSGRVTLALPAAFCREIVAPRLPDFSRAWPGIELELVVPSHSSNRQDDACDLTVVVGPQPDSSLRQKVLLGGRVIWVASPGYAQSFSPQVDSAFSHVRICETRFVTLPPIIAHHGQTQRLSLPASAIKVNDPLSVREALINGLGVGPLAERYCTAALRAGSLVEVWPHVRFEEEAARLAVVFPNHRQLSPRFRAVIQFLSEICQNVV